MNNTNPFIPQGSLLEQKNKKRARVRTAVVFILSLNVALIAPLLAIQGCKRDAAQTDSANQIAADTSLDMTNTLPLTSLPVPAMSTNPVVATASNTTPVAGPGPIMPPANLNNVPTVPGQATDYVVVSGDTYSTIAKKFPGVKVAELEKANPDKPPTKLKVGDKLKVPAPTATLTAQGATGTAGTADAGDNIYVVKAGENLTKIATNHGTTVKAIQSLNNLTTTQIKAGQKLKLPAKAVAAVPTADAAPAATPTSVVSNPMSAAGMVR
jgi:LysM repeat protein